VKKKGVHDIPLRGLAEGGERGALSPEEGKASREICDTKSKGVIFDEIINGGKRKNGRVKKRASSLLKGKKKEDR